MKRAAVFGLVALFALACCSSVALADKPEDKGNNGNGNGQNASADTGSSEDYEGVGNGVTRRNENSAKFRSLWRLTGVGLTGILQDYEGKPPLVPPGLAGAPGLKTARERLAGQSLSLAGVLLNALNHGQREGTIRVLASPCAL